MFFDPRAPADRGGTWVLNTIQKSRKLGSWGRPVKLSFFAYDYQQQVSRLVPARTASTQSTRRLREDRTSLPDPGHAMAIDVESILSIVLGLSIIITSNRTAARPQRGDFELPVQQPLNCSPLEKGVWSLEKGSQEIPRLVLGQLIFALVNTKLPVTWHVVGLKTDFWLSRGWVW